MHGTVIVELVQSKEGKQAGAIVSSELAAMFAYQIIPTIRSHYYDPSKPGMDAAAYERKCRAFAARIGLRPDQWAQVTLPCFISLDWDTRHTFVRQTLAAPRLSAEALAAFDLSRCVNVIPAAAPGAAAPPLVLAPAPPAANLMDRLAPDETRAHDHQAELLRRQLHDDALRRNLLVQAWNNLNQDDLRVRLRWTASLEDVRFIIVLERMYMPLSKISPDIHSPVEHMVGTIKREVKKAARACDFSPRLWKGKTYQEFINDAVARRGNGESGKAHIGGSVKKQVTICRILAAEKGEMVMIDHVPGRRTASQYQVPGTGGGWITYTNLT